MSKIIPAILSPTFEDFKKKLSLAKTFPEVRNIQVDFTDNRFVENTTILPNTISSLPINFIFEAHLMVEKPIEYLANLQKAGFEKVAFHFEVFNSKREIESFLTESKTYGLKPQLAINPNVNLSEVKIYFNLIEEMLVMGVEPGFSGGRFIPETIEKVNFLRANDFYGTITVDGGIKKEVMENLIIAGADNLVIGSAIFNDKDPLNAYVELFDIAKKSL